MQIERARYQSQQEMFVKETAVKAALKQFLSDSLEDTMYLALFLNTTTMVIKYDIPHIIQSLFDN